MIQIYKQDNTNYGNNGDMTLQPIECILTADEKANWELTISHPLDEERRFEYIKNGAVIAAPTFVSNKQLFRIYNTIKTSTFTKAYARPIFFDSANDVFLVDTRPTGKTCQEALDIMMAGTKYKGVSNIVTTSTAYYVRKNLIEAIQSDDDQSVINRWGGEVYYDNYTIYVNDRIGGDYGVKAEFGRNIRSIEENIDMSDVITRIVPTSYNGYTLEGSEPWVESPLFNKYPIAYTKVIHFEDVKLTEDADEDEESFPTLTELRAELIRRCKEQFELGADKPICNYKVDMIDLSQTREYKDYQVLESVSLGDTVKCINRNIGIETEARVIKLTWDCVRNCNTKVELGRFTYNYFNDVQSKAEKIDKVVNNKGDILAEKIAGILDGMKTQLKYQKDVANKQDVRAILFEDLDTNSELYGALCIGTQGVQIANKRTADNKDWDWTTAITANGINALALIVGVISDKSGKSYWDLESGKMQMTGNFLQRDVNGKMSVAIQNNQAKFYAWNDAGNYVGSIGSVKEDDGRVGLNMWCDVGDKLYLGYAQSNTNKLATILSYDSNKPNATPYLRNTVPAGTIYPPGNGEIMVENGLIRGWHIPNRRATGRIEIKVGDKINTIDVEDGVITDWTTWA